jgi:hypothetical protein
VVSAARHWGTWALIFVLVMLKPFYELAALGRWDWGHALVMGAGLAAFATVAWYRRTTNHPHA